MYHERGKPISAISVEDDPLWASVITKAIVELPNASFLGAAKDGQTALRLSNEFHPDVAFVDLRLPDCCGLDLAAKLRAGKTAPRIIFLTARSDDLTLLRAWDGSVHGLVWKTTACREHIHAAFSALSDGRRYFPPEVLEAVTRFRGSPTAFFKILSLREQELVEYFVGGKSDEAVATDLGLSSHTVHTHRKRIMAKLDLHTTRDLIQWGADRGFSTRPVSGMFCGEKMRQDEISP